MDSETTLAAPVDVAGIGLHHGTSATVTLRPAPAGQGYRFVRTGRPDIEPLRAHVEQVVDTRLATTLGHDGWRVSTVEHLMAALWCEGIDNVDIEVDGDEVPVLDGSSLPWVDAIRRVGKRTLGKPRPTLVMTDTVEVRDGKRWARLSPSPKLTLQATIHFEHPAVGERSSELVIENGTFGHDVAWARTFGFLQDVEALRRMGLARGGSLDNAVVFGPDGVMNEGGLRHPDETVRHKILDMLGDLALIGRPVRGRFESYLPGHALSHELVRAVLAAPTCWQLES